MFNPSSLKVIRQGKDTNNFDGFVGIRHTKSGETEFCLPFGFENFTKDDNEKVTKMFFSLYRIFQCFQSSFKNGEEKNKRKDADGLMQSVSEFTFVNKDEIAITLYSKLASIESILASYDELRIFSLVTKYKRTERVNYAHLDKYLHQAIYLNNHIPFIDEMVLPLPMLEYSITDLVQMYCYVLYEIKLQLEEENQLPPEIIEQAKIFHELNLQPDSSLFSKNHDFTINLLRSVLDEVHKKVSLKDVDYWYFYDALESFLYGTPNPTLNEQILWGITNFSPVWEDMCMVYMNRTQWDGVWYADTHRFANNKFGGRNIFLDDKYKNPFCFQLNGKRRWLRPDLVRVISSESVDEWFNENFSIEWSSIYSCSITLNNSKEIAFFNELDKKIRRKNPQRRQKKENQTKVTYSPAKKITIQEAVTEFKGQTKKLRRFNQPSFHAVIDFKYVDINSFTNKDHISHKIKMDIIKQLTYEYAIMLNKTIDIVKTKSQLCIPYIFQEKNIEYDLVQYKDLNTELTSQGIEVWKLNFSMLEKYYTYTE